MTRSGPIYTCQYQYYYSASQRKPALLHQVNKSDRCNKQVASRAASEADWSAGRAAQFLRFSAKKNCMQVLFFGVVCMFSPFSPQEAVFINMWSKNGVQSIF